jgi:DNA excision repair protein ERCC-3
VPAAIAPFAELERSPEHVHTYRVTPLALWNARAAGHDAEQVVDALVRYSRYPVPHALLVDVADTMDRFGRLTLVNHPVHGLTLATTDRAVLEEVVRSKRVAPMLGARVDADTVVVPPLRARPAQAGAAQVGWPPRTSPATSTAGAPHRAGAGRLAPARLPAAGRRRLLGRRLGRRRPAVRCGQDAGRRRGHGAGQGDHADPGDQHRLGRQWKRELVARTSLTEEEIGEYSGERKEIRPVTIATYQVMTTRRKGEYRHLDLFDAQDWGLIVYDEVHLLPAPIFRLTADLQSRRRLGLTATLVREDGREDDVFSLIGPKRYDAPWKDIESQGYIAPAECIEVRVALDDEERMTYAVAEPEERYRIAATATSKLPVIRRVLERHPGEQKLVIGAYLDQLDELGRALDAPVIQGSTTNRSGSGCSTPSAPGRSRPWSSPRSPTSPSTCPRPRSPSRCRGRSARGRRRPSGSGAVLRPKADGRQAHFYTVVSRDTLDAEYAAHRQRFLAEQGYAYTIVDAADLAGPGEVNGPTGWTSPPTEGGPLPPHPSQAQGGARDGAGGALDGAAVLPTPRTLGMGPGTGPSERAASSAAPGGPRGDLRPGAEAQPGEDLLDVRLRRPR